MLNKLGESSLEEEVEEDIDMQEEQVLKEELDRVQEQEPEYQPYQLTRFYWNQLENFPYLKTVSNVSMTYIGSSNSKNNNCSR